MKSFTNLEKIVIIGDSFAGHSDKSTDWVRTFTDRFENATLDCKGFPGCSWWPLRLYLKDKLNTYTPDILILCHTEPNRVVTRDNQKGNKSNTDPIFTKFFNKYYNLDFGLWSTQRWYDELDDLLLSYNIPYVVHFFSFPYYKYEFKQGITSSEDLWSIQCTQESPLDPNKRNHFTDENNKLLGNLIFDELKLLAEQEKYNSGYYNFNLMRHFSKQ